MNADALNVRTGAGTNNSSIGLIRKNEQEKTLADGDRILLGNEEFIFKIREM